jgi:recombination protein RecA
MLTRKRLLAYCYVVFITLVNEVANMGTNNRDSSLQEVMNQIEKKFGKGSIMKLGDNRTMDVETISTGSLTLDNALGCGGLPLGRIVEIYQSQTLSGSPRLTPSLFAA